SFSLGWPTKWLIGWPLSSAAKLGSLVNRKVHALPTRKLISLSLSLSLSPLVCLACGQTQHRVVVCWAF
ncbi:MAG: hypothetical protein N7Q72_01740, partial [Spiroplasma sp. Tabriz.8]|nr:hypothetical protein [Spiroplasma sp. Tabriz.8]